MTRNDAVAPRDIAVVIVAHQSASELPSCLDALARAAPRSRLSIIGVDNASTDGSAEILKAYRALVIRERSNTGFAAAVNKAMRHVTAPMAILLNPDVIAQPEAIDRLADAAESFPQVPAFGGRTLFADGTTNPTNAWAAITPHSALFTALGLSSLRPRSAFFNPEALPDWDRTTNQDVEIATGCALLVRADLFRNSDGFNERYWLYGEEAEWQNRLRAMGHPPARIVADAVFTHVNGYLAASNGAGTIRMSRALRGRATLMRDSWPPIFQPLVSMILRLHALRYLAQSFAGGTHGLRHATLWRTRHDWIAGYPEPTKVSGAKPRSYRLIRGVAAAFSPRAYVQALRVLNYHNYMNARPRTVLTRGRDVEISPKAIFTNAAVFQWAIVL